MKALYVGSTRGTSCALHYYTNLVRLGIDALPFDPEYFVARSFAERLALRLRGAPTRERVASVSESVVQLCLRNHFDLVFVMAENYLGHSTIELIRKKVRNPPVFLYHSHDNNFSSGIRKPTDFEQTLRAYDYVFTTKSQNVERYRALGQSASFFVPSAFEPMVHHPIADCESRVNSRGIDISFIGTYDRSRDPVFESMGWDHLHVWGDFWRRSRHYSKHANRIDARAVYYFEFADIISHSKINLGLLRAEAEDRHTQKTFEIPACGGLQFAPRNDEIASFFNDGEEIVLFESVEDLKEKAVFYLNNETARKKIALAGYARCLRENHTYVDRVQKMLEVAQLGRKRSSRALKADAF